MPISLSALQIPIRNSYIILTVSSDFSDDMLHSFNQLEGLPQGWYGILEKSSFPNSSIYYTSTPSSGFQNLQLFENKEYFLLDLPSVPKTSGFELKPLPRVENKHFRFCIQNYLGSAYLLFENGEYLHFDVISRKLRYSDEYHSMVSSIANECNQLLLDWSTPTTLPFVPDPNQRRQLLLEQFLFLRHVLSAERLDWYLEILRRHPHTSLAEEEIWKPTGTADPAPEYFQDPMRYGRHWIPAQSKNNLPLPQEVLSRRKYETLDTSTNRFIRFALETFRDTCELVIKEFSIQQGTAWIEALDMRNTLDSFLADPFFSDVGRLTYLPGNNQTLMKREGYRQILHAWLMLDTAAQLDWPGREDAYDGTKRDVPTLYEYWIYFVLRKLLREVENLEEIPIVDSANNSNNIKPFLVKDEKGLRINLKRGRTSVSVYRWQDIDGIPLRIHFYFDREFGRNQQILGQGTYTRAFKPDYTLVIFQDFDFDDTELDLQNLEREESQAENNGCIAYLHFDAKYRVEEIKDFLGHQETAYESYEVDNEKKESKIYNTYRRADLYKMHTYNEAIRRTVGSYVLYPGTDENLDNNDRLFRRYHEILPGVGAFILRPLPNGSEETFAASGKNSLLEFIRDVLHIQQNRFSQLYRLNYWTHNTVKENSPLSYNPRNVSTPNAPSAITDNIKPLADILLLVGFIRPEAMDICKEKRLFYYHAVNVNGKTINLDPNIFYADYLLPYTTNGELLRWVSKIRSTQLVSRSELLKYLNVNDDGRLIKSDSLFYYLVYLEESIHLNALPNNFYNYISKRDRTPFTKKWTDLFLV